MGNNNEIIENNRASIIGEVISGFSYSHEIYGEGFYMMDLQVKRLSDQFDVIPVMVSERLVDIKENFVGQILKVEGQFRSYNRHEERKNRLVLSVFARNIEVLEALPDSGPTSNSLLLDGYVCKEPVYRKTPLGREICDILLAVNRPYGKSDYIPCIAWGRNARFANNFRIGDRVVINGRIQSREYMKKINDDEVEKRVAYEVSVAKIDFADDNNDNEQ